MLYLCESIVYLLRMFEMLWHFLFLCMYHVFKNQDDGFSYLYNLAIYLSSLRLSIMGIICLCRFNEKMWLTRVVFLRFWMAKAFCVMATDFSISTFQRRKCDLTYYVVSFSNNDVSMHEAKITSLYYFENEK